jgi:phosphohistidine phosphatase
MARRLVLIRHAKAEAEAPSDAERPLAPRGHRDAAAIGRWLADNGLVPDLAIVSPARRTRQTWAEIAAVLAGETVVSADERIYDNSAKAVLASLRDVGADVATVAVVGHNPTMHELAATLDDGTGAPSPRAEVAGEFPTSAVAVFDVPVGWAELRRGRARLTAYAKPRG